MPGDHSFTSTKERIKVNFVPFLLDNRKQKLNNPRDLKSNLKFILTHATDILKMPINLQSN